MKSILLLLICQQSLTLFCQDALEGPWKLGCGASTTNTFKKSSCFNLRCISPRFKYNTDDWTEEMEEHLEKYRRVRFMMELIYTPPLSVLCAGINLQYRILKYKRLTLEIVGGFKFILIAPPDFIKNPHLASLANKGGQYMNTGLICQLDLGIIAPFADVGYDGMITIGAELNFHAIYRNPKRRYKLPTQIT